MKLSERQWKTCPTCDHKQTLLREEIYGCDTCKTVIDLNTPEGQSREYLEAQRFTKKDATTQHHFCSWKCLAKWLRTVKTDYFISLPYLTYDTPQGKKLTNELLNLLKGRR